MKKLITFIVVSISMLVTSGCMNCLKRTEEGTSYYKTRGYHGHEHPYRSTKEVWDCLCSPFRGGSADPIMTSFVTLTWPFWLVDDILEAAVDTVLLPVDLIGMSCSRDADIKVEEVKEEKNDD